MAKGKGPIQEAAAAAAEQQRRFAEMKDSWVPELFGKEIKAGGPDGGPLIVRFLEQDQEINSFERHPFQKPGKQYPDRYTCLSEVGLDCPACRAGVNSSRKGAYNLIVRNRAVYRKGADGKVIRPFILDGRIDQVVVWECSNTTANVIVRADGDYGGLMTRDFQLRYTGNDKNPYDLVPAMIDGGPQPLSDADMALAAKKFDLDKVFAPPTQQEMAEMVLKYGANSGASGPSGNMPSAIPQQAVANPYLAGSAIPPSAFAAAQEPPKTPAA